MPTYVQNCNENLLKCRRYDVLASYKLVMKHDWFFMATKGAYDSYSDEIINVLDLPLLIMA